MQNNKNGLKKKKELIMFTVSVASHLGKKVTAISIDAISSAQYKNSFLFSDSLLMQLEFVVVAVVLVDSSGGGGSNNI